MHFAAACASTAFFVDRGSPILTPGVVSYIQQNETSQSTRASHTAVPLDQKTSYIWQGKVRYDA